MHWPLISRERCQNSPPRQNAPTPNSLCARACQEGSLFCNSCSWGGAFLKKWSCCLTHYPEIHPNGFKFHSQIPTVLDLLQQIHAKTMFDVGKGFGKYGLLVHEYFGIPTAVRPDPRRMLREQSTVVIDAVESNPFYMWPP